MSDVDVAERMRFLHRLFALVDRHDRYKTALRTIATARLTRSEMATIAAEALEEVQS